MDRIFTYFKRPQVWGFFLSMAVMAIISIAFFAPDNFDGSQLMQSDIQQGQANSHESELYNAATGDKALWTNALFSGMPTFQISPSYPSNSLFTWLNGLYGLYLPAPSNLLFMMMFGFLIMLYCMRQRWYYALIGAIAWGFSSYFIIIIGAGHIWKFLALSFIPPTIGGLVLCYRHRYLLGGALTALFAMLQLNANHPQMTYYFGFVMVGLVIVYLIYAVRDRQVKQWVASTAILIGAGILALGANLPSLYNTYEYTKETKRSQSELTPLASADDQANPKTRPTGGLPKEEIVGWSYGGSEMFTLLVPNVKGGASIKAFNGQPQYMGLDKLDGASSLPYDQQQMLEYLSQRYGVFTQYFNDSESTNGPVYVGALICALFLLGCIIVRGPMKWCLIILTVLSMLLALGRNFESLTDLMIYNFPMYSKFRAVESILVIAEFTIPLLAVLGLVQYLTPGETQGARAARPRKTNEHHSHETALYISFGICAFFCLIGLIWPSAYGNAITSKDEYMLQYLQQQGIPTHDLQLAVEQLRYGMVRNDSLRSLIFIAIGFIPLWLYGKGNAPKTLTIAIVGGAILVDLYTVDKRYVDHDNFVETNPYTASMFNPFAADALDNLILADTAQSYRVMDIPGFSSATRSYHHKMIGGYHAAKLNRYEDLIQRRMHHVCERGYKPELRIDSVVEMYSPQDQAVIRELRADYRTLDMLNAKYIITGDKEHPITLNTNALGNAWLVDTLSYVDGADAEMDALSTLNPATQAVADRKFSDVLGAGAPTLAPGDTIYLTSYSPNRLTYHAATTNGGIGVFSEIYFPWGWRAEINGTPAPLARVNYVLRALRLPPGQSTVTMTFDPASLHTTGTIAYASVSLIYLLLAGALFAGVLRKESKTDKDTDAGLA